ncbi:hypothetical protein JCM3774_006665 [Rhodotorula dairenensis]
MAEPRDEQREHGGARSAVRLPLASSLARVAPTHPLVATLLVEPVLVRVAHLERTVLASAPAQTLLRLGLATERTLVAVVVALAALAAAKWRAQWRAMVYVIALGDAARRTVALLTVLSSDASAMSASAPASRGHPTDAPQADAAAASHIAPEQETQHLLSFWLLVTLVSFAESFRTSPRHPLVETFSSSRPTSFSSRAAKSLRALRHAYLQFIRRYILPTLLRTRWAAQRFVATYPTFDPAPLLAKLPAAPNHFYLRLPFYTRSSSRPRASFPQPRAHPSDRPPRGPGPIPLAWSWFISSSAVLGGTNTSTGAEIRWTLFKLVVLLLGQRTDALGARNVLWKWGIEPLVAVSTKLRRDGNGAGGPRLASKAEKEEPIRIVKQEEPQAQRRRRVLAPLQQAPPDLHVQEPSFAAATGYSLPADSSQEYDLQDVYGHYTLADAPPVSPYAWTPRLSRTSRAPTTAASRAGAGAAAHTSSTSTPRRPRSRSGSPSSGVAMTTTTATAGAAPTSPSPFQLHSPPFLPSSSSASTLAARSAPATVVTSANAAAAAPTTMTNGNGNGTPVGVTYRFASAHHPLLLGPRSTGSAASTSSIATTSTHHHHHSGSRPSQPQPLTASALALIARTGSVRSVGRPSSFHEEDEELEEEEEPEADEDEDEDQDGGEDEDDEGLMTPGEEEAEEGQRKWAGIAP